MAPSPPEAPARAAARLAAEHHRRVRWLIVAGVGLFVLVLWATLHAAWLAVKELEEERARPTSKRVADRFLEWVALGEEGRPDDPGDALTGYGHAYELLTESLRARRDFASFHEDFARQSDRLGPIVDWVREDARGRLLVDLEFTVYRGAAGRHRDALTPCLLELRLARGGEGWRVAEYRLGGRRRGGEPARGQGR